MVRRSPRCATERVRGCHKSWRPCPRLSRCLGLFFFFSHRQLCTGPILTGLTTTVPRTYLVELCFEAHCSPPSVQRNVAGPPCPVADRERMGTKLRPPSRRNPRRHRDHDHHTCLGRGSGPAGSRRLDRLPLYAAIYVHVAGAGARASAGWLACERGMPSSAVQAVRSILLGCRYVGVTAAPAPLIPVWIVSPRSCTTALPKQRPFAPLTTRSLRRGCILCVLDGCLDRHVTAPMRMGGHRQPPRDCQCQRGYARLPVAHPSLHAWAVDPSST